MEGYPPLANYDLTYKGLGTYVTARGFKEIYNPGSPLTSPQAVQLL